MGLVMAKSEIIPIGTIGNYYGGLAVTRRGKKYFFGIENYDGAPAIRQALDVMISAYDGLGLKDLADQSRAVYALNFPDGRLKRQRKRWFQFW